MILKKVKIKNFRQYYGESELEFATSKERNVTIIHGENGVGKTALLNAIKWAFFATLTPNFRNQANLVNDAALSKGDKKCRVEIEFLENGRNFLLQRSYNQDTRKNILKIYEEVSGTWSASLPDPELVINGMLPKEMAEYFFFQGEGSNAVDSGNSQGNLAKSIRDILGFKVAQELISTLKKLSKETRKLAADHDKTGESQKIAAALKRNEDMLDSKECEYKNFQVTIPALEKKRDETAEKLAQINNHDLKTLRSDEAICESDLVKFRRELKLLQRKKYENIAQFGWSVFAADFADASLEFIDESQIQGKLPEPYNKTFVEDILREEVCICGACLDSNSPGYKKITEMLGKAANPILQQRLTGIRAQIQDIKTLNSLANESISSILTNYDDKDEQIQKLEIKLKTINEKISLIPEEVIKRLQSIKNNVASDIKNQLQLQGSVNADILRLKDLITKQEKELAGLSVNGELLKGLNDKKRFIDELREYLESYLDRMEDGIRLHVLAEVNSTLEKFSRHDFHIKVTPETFRFHLLDKDGNNVGQGDGLNLLLNLTITASLISFAAERQKIKDPILSSATVAPLIIDAPFGVLDKKYRNVVVSQLPKHAGQVIFLVSSSQWDDEMESFIKDRIGKEYCLVLEESSAQNDKELDVISICGEDYNMSRYGCDVDRTVIEEVNL